MLYTCNNTGFLNVTVANQYGIVVFDWTNAKNLWANTHPMTSEEDITIQAVEMVYAQDPGVPGYAPVYGRIATQLRLLTGTRASVRSLTTPRIRAGAHSRVQY